MTRIPITSAAIATVLLALAGCDNTYTPSLHHQTEASTGSHLAGIDTGANDNPNDPSLKSNGHSAPGGN